MMMIFWLGGGGIRLFWQNKIVIQAVVGVFMGTLSISTVLGADFLQSIWSNYERMMGLWTLVHVFIFFIIISNSFRREREWIIIFYISSASATIISLIAIAEWVHASFAIRVGSTLKNSAFLASYVLLSCFIILWLFLRDERVSWKSVLLGGALIICLTALLLTGTRGAYLALWLGMFWVVCVCSIVGPRQGHTISLNNIFLRRAALGVMISMIIVITTIFIFREKFMHSSFDPLVRVASASFTERTFEGRMLAWKIAWNGWKEHFFLGWGTENFNLLFNKYYNPDLYKQEPWFDRAHNFIFDIGSTSGIIGLSAYLAIFVVAFQILIKQWRKELLPFWTLSIFSGALVAHLVQNLFVFDAITSLVLLFVFFAFISNLSTGNALEKSFNQDRKGTPMRLVVGVLVVLPMLYIGAWKPFWENRFGKLGYDAFAQGDDERGRELVEKALAYNTYGNIDVRRAVAEYVFEFLKQGGARDPESLKDILDYAIIKMEENIKEKPLDVKWYMYEGQLYNLRAALIKDSPQEDAKKAEKLYIKSAELSPGRPQIYLEIAQARKVFGNYDGMWEAIDIAKKLVPEYSIVHINALVHAIDTGNLERETEEFRWLEERNVFDYASVRDAYYRMRRLQNTIAMQLKYIAKLEESSQVNKNELAREYKNLAVFYRDARKLKDARDAALKVGELDPAQKKNVEAFIASLGNIQ